MVLNAQQFGKAVVSAGLLSVDEVKALWAALPAEQRTSDGETLARALVEREKLTRFQADELLSGSSTPLVLGDYVLLAKIGAGGMGQVFKARHRRMKRFAAIKLLPPALTKDEEAVKRFEREVEAAAKLSHPNIVQTHDAGVHQGVWYLAMEFVDGSDLAAARSPLPVGQACNYLAQAARGLAYAHENGVVHRDIKPSNLLLDKKGTVKILDMGLARLDDQASVKDGLTQSGQVMGTVDYMAPEQALDTHKVDHRADIYSLGCTLYRLLTGQNLFEGETLVQKLVAHQTKPIPNLAQRRPDVPPGLVAVFERMVAKLPDDRYRTMAEVEAALAAFASGGPSLSTASVAAEPAPSFPAVQSPPLASGAAVEPTIPGVQLLTPASPPVAPETALHPTVALVSPLEGTDPVSQRSIQLVREESASHPRTKSAAPPRLPRALLLAAACGGLLLLLLGVWVIIRDKDGKEIARIPVPAGGTATVEAGDNSAKPVPSAFVPPPPAKAPFNAQEARGHQEAWAKYLGTEVVEPNSIGMQMALIPPGEFLMGSSDEGIALGLKIAEETKLESRYVQRIQDERPQHPVRITKPFRMGIHEVTIGQFAKFIEQSGYKTQAEEFGGNSDATKADDPRVTPESKKLNWRTPGQEVGENSPVAQVSWNDAVAFCNWLSEQEKLTPSYVRNGASWKMVGQPNGYRLPTEAEWEYACRAGTTTQFWFGDDWKEHDKYGWSNTNSSGRPHDVGLLPANPFSLRDMHGNVLEWCHDSFDAKWYATSPTDDPSGPPDASSKVSRSGSWLSTPAVTRSTYRHSTSAGARRHEDRGFRVALSATVPTGKPAATSEPPQPSPVAASSPADWPPYTAELLHTLPGNDAEFVLDNKLRIGRKLYDPETGEFLRDLLPESETRELAAGPAVSQDGSRLAWITKDGELTVWDSKANDHLWKELLAVGQHRRLALSPDGKLIAVAEGKNLRVWQTKDKRLLTTITGPDKVGTISFSPQSRWLAYGAWNWQGVWNCASGENRKLPGSYSQPISVGFSVDEEKIVFGMDRHASKLPHLVVGWDLTNLTMLFESPSSLPTGVAFSQDGRAVIFSAGKSLVVAQPGETSQTILAAATDLGLFRVSHDQRFLTVNTYDNRQFVYRLLPISSADRAAAEALLPYCNLELTVGGNKLRVPPNGMLPAGPFALRRLEFIDGEKLPATFITEILIPKLTPLQSLAEIRDGSNRLNGNLFKALPALASSPCSQSLKLLHTYLPLSAQNVAVLHKFPRLYLVQFNLSSIAELSPLKTLPPGIQSIQLHSLGLHSKLSDEQLRIAVEMPVTWLHLQTLDDATLARFVKEFAQHGQASALYYHNDFPAEKVDLFQPLAANSKLKLIQVNTSDAGAQRLAELLPKCRIEYGEKAIFPKIDKLAPAAGETVDLLPRIDPQVQTRAGTWTKTAEGLFSAPQIKYQTLELPVQAGGAYRLEATVERVEGVDSFGILLPVGESEVRLLFDAFATSTEATLRSGLDVAQQKMLKDQTGVYGQNVFAPGKAVQLVVECTPQSIRASADGVTVVAWEGKAADLSVPPSAQKDYSLTPRALALTCHQSGYRITKLTYTPLAEQK